MALRCNFTDKDGVWCGTILERAVVTGCSHLFCENHAQEWFARRRDCPSCQAGDVDFQLVDLASAERRQKCRKALLGLSPMEIFDAVDTAIHFWTHHKGVEAQGRIKRQISMKQRLVQVGEAVEARLVAGSNECQALQAQQRSLQKAIEAKEQERTALVAEEQRCVRDLSAAEEQLQNLQRKAFGQAQQEDSFVGKFQGASPGLGRPSPGLGRPSPGMAHQRPFQDASPGLGSRAGTPVLSHGLSRSGSGGLSGSRGRSPSLGQEERCAPQVMKANASVAAAALLPSRPSHGSFFYLGSVMQPQRSAESLRRSWREAVAAPPSGGLGRGLGSPRKPLGLLPQPLGFTPRLATSFLDSRRVLASPAPYGTVRSVRRRLT